jgi:phage antirepressor YoqD-like protein
MTEIPIYPNLEILICNFNKIKVIKDYKKLINLQCSNNLIDMIEGCDNLENINCSNNNLDNLKYFPKLKDLQCYNNKITKLLDYETLNILYCFNNLINEIGNYPNLQLFDCSNNKLTNLPNINNWRMLEYIKYDDNPIIHLAPHIIRAIMRINHPTLNNDNAIHIFNDDQNIHNSNIQKTIKKSIEEITKDAPKISYEEMMNEINTSTQIEDFVKEIINESVKSNDLLVIIQLTYKEVLYYVWNIIREHSNKDEIISILNCEIRESYGKCFTGKVGRLINSLNGFDPRINIAINDNEQIGNIIILIQNKLETDGVYTIESHKDLVRKELQERSFDEAVINQWIDAIE